MHDLDLSKIELNDNVYPEPTLDDRSVVLWFQGERVGQFQIWERIASDPDFPAEVRQNVSAARATWRPMRQAILGFIGRLTRSLDRSATDSWFTPTGEPAEPAGPKKDNGMLVWSDNAEMQFDEAQIKQLWDDVEVCKQLGKNFFFVSVTMPPISEEPQRVPTTGPSTPAAANLDSDPVKAAGQQLAAARESGDRRAQATSLTDLGILLFRQGQTQRAIEHLEQAVAISRSIQDYDGENDALGELGLAVLAKGDPHAARATFEQVLAHAREVGNRFREKTMLANLGMTWYYLRDPAAALDFYQQSLAIDRELGDRERLAETLWSASIQQAELGQRDQALASAEESVKVYRELGDPKAQWFATHLENYRRGEADATLGVVPADPAIASQSIFGGSIDVNFATMSIAGPTPPVQKPTGPGLLRMAVSAGAAMAKFIASGMKTTSADTHQHRLQMCKPCEHHTGVRCRLCGCFTNQKAWLPHEHCPMGKWPDD